MKIAHIGRGKSVGTGDFVPFVIHPAKQLADRYVYTHVSNKAPNERPQIDAIWKFIVKNIW